MTPTELSQDLVKEFVLNAHGNFARVKELHQQHPDLLNARFEQFNETALEAAGHTGQRPIAEYLLEHGAPLNIYAAAMLGITDRVADFLNADPSLANGRGVHGISILFHAAMSGKTEIADLLVAHGGGEDADNALHGALAYGHLNMVRWLLDHGATNLEVRNWEDKTLLQKADELGRAEIAELLRRRGAKE